MSKLAKAHERYLAAGQALGTSLTGPGLSYGGRMTAVTISFRARLYAQAARDAERLRNDPAELAEIKAVNEELDEISAW